MSRNEPNEINEMWRDIKKDRQVYKQGNRDKFQELLSMLQGHKVVQLTVYQYRIDDMLDFYPSNKKWHLLKTGERGQLRKIEQIKDILA